LFLYRKNHGSGLWITGPWLALGPWWIHDHGAGRPLRGSGGHRDSSKGGKERERERERARERERRSSEFSPMVPLGGRAAEMTT
jgi:hypothetical protein